MPEDEVVPHPLIFIVVPAKVWVVSDGRQAYPALYDKRAGAASLKIEKSKS